MEGGGGGGSHAERGGGTGHFFPILYAGIGKIVALDEGFLWHMSILRNGIKCHPVEFKKCSCCPVESKKNVMSQNTMGLLM